MSDQTATSHSRKAYWFLGAGGFLSILWCSVALATDSQWQAHLWSVLIIALAGFIPALAGLLWLKGQPNRPRKAGSTELALSLLYPLIALGGFAWAIFRPFSTLFSIITHPLLLVINLSASLLVGAILNRLNGRVHKGLALTAWWLWHLPLIFINGTALLRLDFSNLLMILYLVTILALSFGLSMQEQS